MMKELIEEIRLFSEQRNWLDSQTPENLAKSVSIEAAELLECFQWNNEYNRQAVQDELADVMIYCLQMVDRLQLDPEEIIRLKMVKNAIKYPCYSNGNQS